jgi:hypothetical protein
VVIATINVPIRKFVTVLDWTQGAGDFLQTAITGQISYTVTEGAGGTAGFTAEISNEATAENMKNAINAVYQAGRASDSDTIMIRATREGATIALAVGAEGTGLTLTSGDTNAWDEGPSARPQTYSFCSGDRPFEAIATGTVTYPNSIIEISTIGREINPVTRETSIGEVEFVFADDGWLRRLMRYHNLKFAKVDLKIGTQELNEGQFHAMPSVYIDDILPHGDGTITVKCIDALGIPQNSVVSVAKTGTNPLNVLRQTLVSAGVEDDPASEVFDFSSLDVSGYVGTISHFGVSQYKAEHPVEMTPPSTDPVEAIKIINEIVSILQGSLIPDENGRYAFELFDHDAAVDQVIDVGPESVEGTQLEHVSSLENVTNEVVVNFLMSAAGVTVNSYSQQDGDSKNEFKQLLQTTIDSAWLNGLGRFLTETNATLTRNTEDDNLIFLGHWLIDGLLASEGFLAEYCAANGVSGCADIDVDIEVVRRGGITYWWSQDSSQTLSTSRTGFFLIAAPAVDGGEDGFVEIVACKSAVIRQTFGGQFGNHPQTHRALGLVHPRLIDFTIDETYDGVNGFTKGRGGFGTGIQYSGGYPDRLPTDTFLYDVTIPVRIIQTILKRFKFGAPVVRVRLPLEYYHLQIGDFVAFENDDTFLAFGKDGLDASSVFEITRQEISVTGDDIGIELTCTWVRDDVVPDLFLEYVQEPGTWFPGDYPGPGPGEEDYIIDRDGEIVQIDLDGDGTHEEPLIK